MGGRDAPSRTPLHTNSHPLTILQWNCRSIRSKLEDLLIYINDGIHPPDVIAIQESWLTEKDQIKLPGYISERKDRVPPKRGGGLLFLIRNNIPYTVHDINFDIDCLSIKIQINNTTINITNIYDNAITSNLQEYANLFAHIKGKHIVCGDFNAHNTAWGSVKNSHKGNQFLDIFNESKLVLVNDSKSHINNDGAMSAIDLTLTTPDLIKRLQWSATNFNLGSDHIIIAIKLYNYRAPQPPDRLNWNYKKANWPNFTNQLENILNDQKLIGDIDSQYEQLISAINVAADENIPKYKISGLHIPAPWWSDECEIAKQNRNRTRNTAIRTLEQNDHITAKKYQAIFRKTIKESKTQYWKKYCSSLNHSTKNGQLWRKLRQMTNSENSHPPITIIKHNGANCYNDKDKANILGHSLTRASQLVHDSTESASYRHRFEREHSSEIELSVDFSHAYNDNITITELETAIKISTTKSAPGADKISYEMLKNISPATIQVILQLFNQIWHTGTLPK